VFFLTNQLFYTKSYQALDLSHSGLPYVEDSPKILVIPNRMRLKKTGKPSPIGINCF